MQQIICRKMMQLIISNLSLFKDLKGLVIMNKDDRKKDLNSTQFHVTQECGTEPPFHNEFWNNKKAGIYVDIVSGEPLLARLTNSIPERDFLALLNPWKMTILLQK